MQSMITLSIDIFAQPVATCKKSRSRFKKLPDIFEPHANPLLEVEFRILKISF
jgi:hypothetical protein